MELRQIKSKSRVTRFGEVYTSEREVNAMLDLVKKEAASIGSTFFEPACGNGNFLIEVLHRKLKTVRRLYQHSENDYTLNAVQAMTSIYGVDIQSDNVDETRVRLFNKFNAEYVKLFKMQPSRNVQQAAYYVLVCNIQCGDTLSYAAEDGSPLLISEWSMSEDGFFTRSDYEYRDMVENGCATTPIKVSPQLDLLWSNEAAVS